MPGSFAPAPEGPDERREARYFIGRAVERDPALPSNAFGSPASLRTPLAEWRETILPSTGNAVLVMGLYQIS